MPYGLSIRKLYEEKRKGRNKKEKEVKKDKVEIFWCRINLLGVEKITPKSFILSAQHILLSPLSYFHFYTK